MDGSSTVDGLNGNGDLGPSLLDAGLPTPLYHQIYLILRDRIRAGVLARNALLPGEQELGRLFNVSRITVKRALNELAADGLISRHRGRGSIVTRGPDHAGGAGQLLQPDRKPEADGPQDRGQADRGARNPRRPGSRVAGGWCR